MADYKKHISFVLLSGFLLPQGLNSVHYFLIPHDFYALQQNRQEVSLPGYTYHFCDYQLAAVDSTLPKAVTTEYFRIPFVSKKESFSSGSNHINELAFHYSLRGPPGEFKHVKNY